MRSKCTTVKAKHHLMGTDKKEREGGGRENSRPISSSEAESVIKGAGELQTSI